MYEAVKRGKLREIVSDRAQFSWEERWNLMEQRE